MDEPHFLRIERDGPDGSRHYVVHAADPRFLLELTPDAQAPDGLGRGVLKRLCLPNSWAGDYTKYSKFITAAQDFFSAASAPDGREGGSRRPER